MLLNKFFYVTLKFITKKLPLCSLCSGPQIGRNVRSAFYQAKRCHYRIIGILNQLLSCSIRRCASLVHELKVARSSPGKKRARVAVGMGFGMNSMILRPFGSTSFAQDVNKACCAAFDAP